jgi:hypothetical protein
MADEDTDFEGAGEDEDNMDEEDVASPMQFMEEFADTPNSKLLRISEVQLMEQPESYRTNTPKEELMLEYIRKYEVHFANLHPKRRKPMLALRNECGMKKFICATLRPTQMPYQDVYDYNKCAKFVADFIRYEPLELASQLPSHMPSPSATLGWQAGDCFDMAMVLCSMLLGVGYDAYVVCGYAPAKITRYDQTSTSIKAEPPPPPPEPPYKPPDTKYTIGPRKVLASNFLTQKAQREAAAAAPKDAKVAPAAPAAPIDLEALAAAEAEELDDLRGRRVHAWVLLLPGKRMLEQMLFVEPSTGELYRADSSGTRPTTGSICRVRRSLRPSSRLSSRMHPSGRDSSTTPRWPQWAAVRTRAATRAATARVARRSTTRWSTSRRCWPRCRRAGSRGCTCHKTSSRVAALKGASQRRSKRASSKGSRRTRARTAWSR